MERDPVEALTPAPAPAPAPGLAPVAVIVRPATPAAVMGDASGSAKGKESVPAPTRGGMGRGEVAVPEVINPALCKPVEDEDEEEDVTPR